MKYVTCLILEVLSISHHLHEYFFIFRDLIISSVSFVVVYFSLIFGNSCLNALCKYSKGLVLVNKLFLSYNFTAIMFSATVRNYLLNAFAMILLLLVKLPFKYIRDILLTLTLHFVKVLGMFQVVFILFLALDIRLFKRIY